MNLLSALFGGVCAIGLLVPGSRADVSGVAKSTVPKREIRWKLVPPGEAGTTLRLVESGQELWTYMCPADLEVRALEFSWSPKSDACLIGENLKYGMDLILLQLQGGKVLETNFPLDAQFWKRIEAEIPFREEIKSSAPVGRVAWRTVRWESSTRIAMQYIYRGIGYEASAQVTIDRTEKEPVLTIEKLRPSVPAALWSDRR